MRVFFAIRASKIGAHVIFKQNGTVQVSDVADGSGRVQAVGISGKRALDTKVEAGQLVVPTFFVVAGNIAGNEGMEFVSVLTTTISHTINSE
ncbi:hypothetical protein Peur_060882 [Populus x canadensis]